MTDNTQTIYRDELETAVAAAREAGLVIKDLYDRSAAAVYEKSDGSPVTDADLASDRSIRATIGARFPDDAFLTEEVADDLSRLHTRRCWIIDPIDGTAQFIARTGRFDAVIALVIDGRPVVGVICHPSSGTILAAASGAGAWIEQEGHRCPARFPAIDREAPMRVAGSIWFGLPALDAELARIAAEVDAVVAPILPIGIRPIELLAPDRPFDAIVGPVASADTTYGGEWDFAAADLIIHEAGGAMSDLLGHPHRYNKAHERNGGGLIIAADRASHARLVRAAAAVLPAGLVGRD